MTTTNQTQRLRDVAAGGTAVTEKKEVPNNFKAMLIAYEGQIARALPKHLSSERMCRIALTEFNKNPKLADCEPKSVFACVIAASQLGLEIGMQGHGWLVPYYDNKAKKTICQFIPGWQGYADLVARAGRASVWTGAVYQGDEFDYALGDRPFVSHKPGDNVDESEKTLTHVYAVGRIKNSDWPVIEVWTIAKVRRHLEKYNKQGEKHYALKGNLEMYGRKVALLQVMKYMPKSVEVMQAIDLSHSADAGTQNLRDAKEVIEGTWAPTADEDVPTGGGDAQAPESQQQPQQDPEKVKPAAGGLE